MRGYGIASGKYSGKKVWNRKVLTVPWGQVIDFGKDSVKAIVNGSEREFKRKYCCKTTKSDGTYLEVAIWKPAGIDFRRRTH